MYEYDYDFAHIFSTFEHLLQVRKGHDLNTRAYNACGKRLAPLRHTSQSLRTLWQEILKP